MEKKLFRDPNNRLLGGVSSGLARYFDIDTTLVRLAWVVLFLATSGFIPILYGIMWAIVPKENTTIVQDENQEPAPTQDKAFGCLGTFLKIIFALVILFVLAVFMFVIFCLCILGAALISGIVNGGLTVQTIETWF
jgi:phage shock protein PspC (stress-responsive transcriptional regulator)